MIQIHEIIKPLLQLELELAMKVRVLGIWFLFAGIFAVALVAAQSPDPPAPNEDRVGFPKDYSQKYTVLRSVNRPEKQQVVTVYGNDPTATVSRADQRPYPFGSIIVMETATALKDSQGKPLVDDKGIYRKDKVTGLHVMRREKGFGEAYAQNRTGDWEYVEYRADRSYITPPRKSFACAECHVKAGQARDFVYVGRFPAEAGK